MTSHLECVAKLLRALEATRFSLKLSKCAFFRYKLDYLRHTTMPGTLAVAINTDAAIHRSLYSRDNMRLNPFQGACHVYQGVIAKLTRLA